MIKTAKFKKPNISKNATAGFALAIEIADYLAKSGVPFAQAHEVAGACVRYCEEKNIELHQIPADHLENSIDAVSDRDFAAEALFILAMLGVHLSRIGEEFVS